MSRWEPDARGRLQQAALALYGERRFEQTTAAEIAKRAGLIKLASLASAIAGALRRRGVAEPAASLAAEAGIAVFKIAFERWVNETSQADLPQLMRESLAKLKAVTAGHRYAGSR